MRHFLDLLDLTSDEIAQLLKRTAKLKAEHRKRKISKALAGRVVGLIFEKPSLRTRVSFQAAVAQLGGSSIFLTGNEVGLGVRESVPDIARTLSEYVDAVVLRTFSHQTIEEFAALGSVPVINGLSNYYHPCQALADLYTVQEVFGDVKGRTIVFVGDGNNVARSVAICCGKLGARFILAAPPGYGFDEPFLETFHRLLPKGELLQNGAPAHAVDKADIIYTDVWTSMGQEEEREERLKQFAAFQVNDKLLSQAPAHVKVMHCLPAHRGEEVTADVMESEHSVVFQQAGNRMHTEKAVLEWLLD